MRASHENLSQAAERGSLPVRDVGRHMVLALPVSTPLPHPPIYRDEEDYPLRGVAPRIVQRVWVLLQRFYAERAASVSYTHLRAHET